MKKNNYEISSGNVFADLGLPNPEERLAKAELARQINNLIKAKRLTQVQAAELLDIDQPKISALSTGKLSGFSLERLFRFLTILDQDITIKVTPKIRSRKRAAITVYLPKIQKLPIAKKPSISNAMTIQARKKK
jgi:predicted XRE-type DNA-binding protein